MTDTGSNLDRVLVLEMVRVTEAAAIAAAKLIGRGDEKAADAAAVEAMRNAFNTLYMDGTIVIGEGERDEAPMLYIGEKVGSAPGKGPKIDIAVDPLEGTTITAKAGPNALAVLAIAEEGCLLNAPDVYMDKLAVGPGYSPNIVNFDNSVRENVEAVAREKGVAPALHVAGAGQVQAGVKRRAGPALFRQVDIKTRRLDRHPVQPGGIGRELVHDPALGGLGGGQVEARPGGVAGHRRSSSNRVNTRLRSGRMQVQRPSGR